MLLALDTNPTTLPMLLIVGFTLAFALLLLLAVQIDPGPSPEDTAVAYEHAWDRLDFATIWNLSGPNLRDGRTRDQFVRNKLAAYEGESRELSGLVGSVEPHQVDVSGPVARVLARLRLHSGETVVDEMLLERIGVSWQVTGYRLAAGHPRTGIAPPKI